MNKLGRTQKSLFTVHMIRMILELFTSTFLTSYILSLNPDNILGSGILNIGIFYISQYLVYITLYYIISFLVDKSNRVSFLRVGIIVSIFLLIALIFWGEIISHWIILAGSLCGISDAFYYSSYLIMRNELNSRKTIKSFNMLSTIFTNLIKIIVPTILGFLIDITTYSTISIFFLVFNIVQLFVSLMIQSKKPENSNFELKKFIKYLKQNKDVSKKIKYTYLNAFTAGFKSTYKVIVVILTIYTFKTNFSLGVLTSIFSLVTMTSLMIYKKFDNNPKINKFIIYMLIGTLPFVSCIALVFSLNIVTLVLYNFFLTLTIGFSDYLGTIERDAIIKNIGKYEYIAEHQLLIELITCTSRILSYAIFIVIGLLSNIVAFKILLIVLLLVNPIKYLIMYKQRTIRKEYELLNNAKPIEHIPEAKEI